MIRFQCPTCQKALKAPAEWTGRKIKCTGCGQRLQVPQPTAPLPAQNKTILGQNLPSESSSTTGQQNGEGTANCPGCGRTISFQLHELPLTIECAQCKTVFNVAPPHVSQPFSAPPVVFQQAVSLEQMVVPGPVSQSYSSHRRSGGTDVLTIAGLVAGVLALLGMLLGCVFSACLPAAGGFFIIVATLVALVGLVTSFLGSGKLRIPSILLNCITLFLAAIGLLLYCIGFGLLVGILGLGAATVTIPPVPTTQPAVDAKSSSVVGTWESRQDPTAIMIFERNGGWSFTTSKTKQSGRWKNDGDNRFTITEASGKVLTCRVDGNILSLTTDGVVSVWQRK